MSVALKEIEKFQTDRALHKKEYIPITEHINIVEELFESVGIDIPKENRLKLEQMWLQFTSEVTQAEVGIRKFSYAELPEHEKVDAYVDIVVFAVGAIMKQGYDPHNALIEGAKEINSRRGSMVHGKFEKDLSEDAQALWYKADYSTCKKEVVDHSENDSLDLDREI